MRYSVSFPAGNPKGTITLPGSKSISARLLIIRELCSNAFRITNLSPSSDTSALEKALKVLSPEINAGEGGTTFRFLLSLLAYREGEWVLTGSGSMKERPIRPLVGALRSMGAVIDYTGKEGFPPLRIKGGRLRGGKINIDTSVSSQFLSSLMLIAPVIPGGLDMEITGAPVSLPYAEMTLALMRYFGINHKRAGNLISIPEQQYHSRDYDVEPDWSAAAFFFEIAALSENPDILLTGLNEDSLQGDSEIRKIMALLGTKATGEKEGIRLTRSKVKNATLEADLTRFPDLAPPVICTCAALGIGGTFTGIGHLRYKESDRLQAIDENLSKYGVGLKPSGNKWILSFPADFGRAVINSYNDHRIAMAFAPMCLKTGNMVINGAEAVNKSYPGYWNDLERIGFKVEEA